MSATPSSPPPRLSTAASLLRLYRWQPALFTLNLALQVPRQLAFLIPGLIIREAFNTLTQNARITPTLQWLLVLLVASALVRILAIYLSVAVDRVVEQFSITQLRRNLMTRILQLPGARALPYSPGETITRLGGDISEIGAFISELGQLFGMAVYAVVSFVIMARISPLIAASVALPLIVISIVTSIGTLRIQNYRRETRRATGRLYAFIAEIFGAVQAVQVARAENSGTAAL